jgi:clan AA aspartic protease (TIGR02281 family)
MSKIIKVVIGCIALIGLSFQSMSQTTIIMRKKGNVYILPCKVNGLLLDLIFDTGADDVSLSITEAQFMLKNGYLSENDVRGTERYKTANGEISEGTKIIIRKITFAGLEINNVEASVMPNQDAPLLLGQSAIRKLGKIELDPDNNKLIVFKGKGTYDYSKSEDGKNAVAKNGKSDKSNATSNKAKAGQMKEVMTLHIDRPGGANGANVVWHPGQKKYYAAQGGNAAFPLEIFDEKGKMVSDDQQSTMFDVRGFWYNSKKKTFEANGYSDYGWVEYKLNSKGIPTGVKEMFTGRHQPDDQSAGVYDTKNNVVYFYNFSSVGLDRYQMSDGTSDTTIPLHLGIKNKADIKDDAQDDIKYNYNENEVVYTGIPKSEIGVLNVKEKQVELYSLATGLITKVLPLPEDAPTNELMNFSYSNGIDWLFDKSERTWHGYK